MDASIGPSPRGQGEPGDDWGAPGGGAAANVVDAVRSHRLVVVAVVFAALLVGLAWTFQRTRTYEASAEVLVTPLPDTALPDARLPLLRATGDRTRTIQTAANLIDSTAAAAGAAARIGPGWTANDVSAATDVKPQGQSDVLAVTARADDARVAARLANAFTRAALDARAAALAPIVASLIAETERELRAQNDASSPLAVDLAERLADLRALEGHGDPTLSISQTAQPPTAALGPSRSLVVLLALFGGLMVGVGSALVLDLLGPPRVPDAARAVAATGLPVLARVPAPPRRRSGAALSGRLRPGAAAAFQKLQAECELGRENVHSVLLAGVTPGDGTTTCVAEFGLTLAVSGHRVLLVDADPIGPQLAARLGVQPPAPVAVALKRGEDWRSRLADVPRLPALKILTVAESGTAAAYEAVAERLRRVLVDAPARFDYVVVNMAPLAELPESLRLMPAVDAVVLVVRPTRTRIEDLRTTLAFLKRTDVRLDGLLVVSGRERRRRGNGHSPRAGPEPAVRPVVERSP
jgi:Mrp family chromosome partitioning ATPase